MQKAIFVFVLMSLFLSACSQVTVPSSTPSVQDQQNTPSQKNENMIYIAEPDYTGTTAHSHYDIPLFEEMIVDYMQLFVSARYSGKFERCGDELALCFEVVEKYYGSEVEKEITVVVFPDPDCDLIEIGDEKIIYWDTDKGIEYVYQKGEEYLLLLEKESIPNKTQRYFQVAEHFIETNGMNAINSFRGHVELSAECMQWVQGNLEQGESEIPKFIEYVCMVMADKEEYISRHAQ